MATAMVETRVRLASGEFVSVEQGETVADDAAIVAEFPALFGIKPTKRTKSKKGDD